MVESQVISNKTNLFLISKKYFNIKKENSSVGRALVSKTKSQGFKSLFSCVF